MRAAALLIILSTRVAFADDRQVCIEVDPRDVFDDAGRATATTALGRAFGDAGLQVIAAPCGETYRVAHLVLGTSVTVYLEGPRGMRQVTGELADLPQLYARLVRAALAAAPPPRPAPTVAPPPPMTVTVDPVPRDRTDSLWYFAIGAGMLPTATSKVGTGYTAGYRYERAELAVDLSVGGVIVSEQPDTSGAFGIKIEGLYFVEPFAPRSFYVGGGVSVATVVADRPEGQYQKGGVRGELSAGYELLRDARHLRMFVQLDLSLPVFTLQPQPTFDQTGAAIQPDGALYAPTVMLSLGAGFGN